MTQRIPPTTPGDRDERTEELLSGMLTRPDGTVLNIFTTLAHHPKLLKRWAAFGGTLLFGGELPPRDRELLILRTALHCDAEYEWGQHVGIGLASGLTEEEIERLHSKDAPGEWSETEKALLAAAGHLTAYKISKAGVNALVHSLAITNAGHGIRVNGIMPGFIDTPMGVDAPAAAFNVERGEWAKVRAQMVPLRNEQGTAWDVANAALFLASDEASFITGAILPVDGGQSAKIG